MELPSYHLPTFNGIMMHAWHRLKDFILRAGKTILTVIAVIYLLQMITFPAKDSINTAAGNEAKRISVMEMAGKAITPVFEPMGISRNNWQASVALLSGLFAKEAIVGSLQSLYSGIDETSIEDTLKKRFPDTASGFAFLLFILLYSPCAAALTMLWNEHGKLWMGFAFGFLTLQAWLLATLFYQTAMFRINPLQSTIWIALILMAFLMQFIVMQWSGKRYAKLV